jgi:hypothetical protein
MELAGNPFGTYGRKSAASIAASLWGAHRSGACIKRF